MGLSAGLYVLGMLLDLAVQRALVGTRCANSHVDCRNGLKILLSSFTPFIRKCHLASEWVLFNIYSWQEFSKLM